MGGPTSQIGNSGMKCFRRIGYTLCLASLPVTFAAGTFSQQNTPPPAAQSKSQYRTGKLLKIKNTTDILDRTQKASSLLTIQDGSDQYAAYYRITYFSHDQSKDLVAGKDVEYRIAGGHLFVKTASGKEIKTRLCKKVGESTVCGQVTFIGDF
jgi:hypothetical protein